MKEKGTEQSVCFAYELSCVQAQLPDAYPVRGGNNNPKCSTTDVLVINRQRYAHKSVTGFRIPPCSTTVSAE